MKKLVVSCLLLMSVFMLAATDFTYTGLLKTRAALFNTLAPSEEGETINYIDSKLAVEMTFSTSDALKAVWKIQVGSRNPRYIDYVEWGNSDQGGGIDTRGINLQTVDAYLDYKCPVTKSEWKVGLQWWGDDHSLVWDDDFAAIMMNKQVWNTNLEMGYAKLVEGHDWEEDDTADTDSDLYLVNFTTKLFNMQNLFRFTERDAIDTPRVNRFEMWMMPNLVATLNELSVDIMGAYYYSSEKSGHTNSGWAFSAKGTLDIKPKFGFDVLMTSGINANDTKKTNEFRTISEWYMNGLTIFGRGSSHEHACVGWGDFGVYNRGQGIMSLVGTVEVPVSTKTTVTGAMGNVTAMTKKFIGEDGDVHQTKGTEMGFEVNVASKTALTPELTLSVQGAYGIPGDYFKFGNEDLDNLYQLNGYIQYSF